MRRRRKNVSIDTLPHLYHCEAEQWTPNVRQYKAFDRETGSHVEYGGRRGENEVHGSRGKK